MYATREATLRLVVPAGKHRVALLRGDVTAATGSLVVKGDGKTLVGPGAALKAREFAWERFVLDGGATGRTVDLTLSGDAGAEWKLVALAAWTAPCRRRAARAAACRPRFSLSPGRARDVRHVPVPGREATYETCTTATVISTAGDASLTASGPVHLRNSAFSLAEPLSVRWGRPPGTHRRPTRKSRSPSASEWRDRAAAHRDLLGHRDAHARHDEPVNLNGTVPFMFSRT